jgi:hypothetical protein
MQVVGCPAHLNPKVLVFIRGLARPNVPITKEKVKQLIQKHPNVNVIGVCFMSMFEKAGWLDEVSFNMMIDATIDPVTVTWND